MTSPRNAPHASCALTIAGLDPSGGAGISADLRSFAACGVWGCAALAVVTVQSTAGIVSATSFEPALVLAQSREVLAHERVRAIKTGALGSAAVVRAVSALAAEHGGLPLVIDPVMVATHAPTGARLLDPEALAAMREALSLATMATPNMDEAEALLETSLRSADDLTQAAREIQKRFGARAVLVKGGHLTQGPALDVLAIGDRVEKLTSRRLKVQPFHGGGCTLASLIAGKLASMPGAIDDAAILEAVSFAKRRLTGAIRRATHIGDGLLVLPVGPRLTDG